MKIIVRPPTEEEKQEAETWGIWTKEPSSFPWSYDTPETCLILEGHAVITPEEGDPVELSPGDWVEFPQGLKCEWEITELIRKHYKFG